MKSPTSEVYGALETAFRFFNRELFDGSLPDALMTIPHKGKGTRGYVTVNRFTGRKTGRPANEVALNPVHFAGPLQDILATLVHQMVHLWQHCHDKPSRGGYHNRSWAEKILALGLHPSSTGKPGGKTTGQKMHHYLVRGGRFDRASRKLLASGFDVVWAEALVKREQEKAGGDGADEDTGRVAWACPTCSLKAWAKPSARLMCGTCRRDLVRR